MAGAFKRAFTLGGGGGFIDALGIVRGLKATRMPMNQAEQMKKQAIGQEQMLKELHVKVQNDITKLEDSTQKLEDGLAAHIHFFRKEFSSLKDENLKEMKEVVKAIHETQVKLEEYRNNALKNAFTLVTAGFGIAFCGLRIYVNRESYLDTDPQE